MDLKSHTSADSQSGAVGDIEVEETENNTIFEAMEIKHGQVITAAMIQNAYEKFRGYSIDRYYILSTKEVKTVKEKTEGVKTVNEITEKVIQIQKEHGCQVIVNGVLDTIKYYLRLVRKPEIFVSNYVTLVENDAALRFEHRKAWNDIVSGDS